MAEPPPFLAAAFTHLTVSSCRGKHGDSGEEDAAHAYRMVVGVPAAPLGACVPSRSADWTKSVLAHGGFCSAQIHTAVAQGLSSKRRVQSIIRHTLLILVSGLARKGGVFLYPNTSQTLASECVFPPDLGVAG